LNAGVFFGDTLLATGFFGLRAFFDAACRGALWARGLRALVRFVAFLGALGFFAARRVLATLRGFFVAFAVFFLAVPARIVAVRFAPRVGRSAVLVALEPLARAFAGFAARFARFARFWVTPRVADARVLRPALAGRFGEGRFLVLELRAFVLAMSGSPPSFPAVHRARTVGPRCTGVRGLGNHSLAAGHRGVAMAAAPFCFRRD
jgi:hypothetical protein